MATNEHVKLLVVGDVKVGKTCMLESAYYGSFPAYIRREFDNCIKVVTIESKSYNVGLWDTIAEEAYDKLRPLQYKQTDVIFFCFDISSKSSLTNVERKWIPELHSYCPTAARILIGCKRGGLMIHYSLAKIHINDKIFYRMGGMRREAISPQPVVLGQRNLRGNSNSSTSRAITFEEGEKAAASTKCSQYIETSALLGEGIEGLFELAARAAVDAKKASRKRYSIFFSSKSKDSPSSEKGQQGSSTHKRRKCLVM